ncbi:MAG: hypothetical protein WBM46_12340, partial [Polyangiales bacterium]
VGGACLNDPDLEIIVATTPNLRWQAADCGTLCQGRTEPLFLDCVDTCLGGPAPGLSSECSGCYGALAWCAGASCNTSCANTADACSLVCTSNSTQCPGYDACLTALNQCTGRDSLDCLNNM